jgi:hypothetical protein
MGVHPFGDPDIVDEFAAETVPIDACEFHVYAAEWTPNPVALRPFVGWPFAVGDRMWPLTRLVGTSTSPTASPQPLQYWLKLRDVTKGGESLTLGRPSPRGLEDHDGSSILCLRTAVY